MIELAAALEATPLAQFLKASRWVYPLVNAGHVLGLALLVGAVVPMDVGVLRGRAGVLWLRPFAAVGLTLAAATGLLLFITQATDYVQSPWFRAKLAVLALAATNAALHPQLAGLAPLRRRVVAAVSLALWPAVLLLGRMIAYG